MQGVKDFFRHGTIQLDGRGDHLVQYDLKFSFRKVEPIVKVNNQLVQYRIFAIALLKEVIVILASNHVAYLL